MTGQQQGLSAEEREALRGRLPCDCTHDGNDEHTGPKCRQRERDTWARAMEISREIASRDAGLGGEA